MYFLILRKKVMLFMLKKVWLTLNTLIFSTVCKSRKVRIKKSEDYLQSIATHKPD